MIVVSDTSLNHILLLLKFENKIASVDHENSR